MHGVCTVSTVHAPRTRRVHCGQYRTDTGNVCAALRKNKTILILMHDVARCALRRTRSGQAPCSAVQPADSAAYCRTGWARYVADRWVHGAARWLLAASTVPARCVLGACPQCVRCCTVPVCCGCVFEHVQTHWNGWVYCFARLHWIFGNYPEKCPVRIWKRYIPLLIELLISNNFSSMTFFCATRILRVIGRQSIVYNHSWLK